MIKNSFNSEENKLPNLPGSYPLLRDGNLPRTNGNTGPTILVIGTAAGGPSGPVAIRDMEVAAKNYTTLGTLLEGLYEVVDGGASRIIAYRIGASPAVLTGIGNNGAIGGYTITPELYDDIAGRVTKFYYSRKTKTIMVWNEAEKLIYNNSPRCTRDVDSFQDTYRGVGAITAVGGGTYRITDANRGDGLDRPAWVPNSLVGDYRAIPTEAADNHVEIVANGTNWFEVNAVLTPATGIRYRVGVPYTRCYGGFPGIFTTVHGIAASGNDSIVTINGYSGDVSVGDDYPNANDLETNDLKGWYLNPNVAQGETFLIKSAVFNKGTGYWDLTVQGDASAVATAGDTCTAGNWKLKNPGLEDSDYDAGVWATAGSRCGNRFCSNRSCPGYQSSAVDSGEVSVTAVGTWKNYGTYGIGGPDLNGGEQGAPVSMESAISYLVSHGELPSAVNYMEYTAGTDGTDLTKRKLFEHLWDALDVAKNIPMDYIYLPGAWADNPNIKYCARTDTDSFDTTDENYPGADTETSHGTFTRPDVLAWFSVFESDEGDYYFAWDNGVAAPITNVTMTTADGKKSITVGNDPSDPTNMIDFHEVDFGYLIARFCYEVSRDDHFVRAIVPFKAPPGYTQQQINSWIGKKPTVDSTGQITRNGRGLLGFPWTQGRITQGTFFVNFVDGSTGNQEPGYILTEGNFSDEAKMRDNLDHYIDIGKYMLLFAGYGIMNNGFLRNGAGYHGSGAGYALGFNTRLSPKSNFTAKSAPNVSMDYYIRHRTLSDLCDAKLVMFKALSDGSAEFSDGPTAARSDSDYQRWTTMSIVSAFFENLRAATKPYLGEALSEAEEDALHAAWEKVKSQAQSDGWITDATFQWIVRDVDKVVGDTRVKVNMKPVFELRRVLAEVSLSV